MKIKKGTFPEELTDKEADQFPLFKTFYDSSSYKEDYDKAVEFAQLKEGCVYTMVDGEGKKTYYLRGAHFVNRYGYCVLGWKE